MNDLNKVYFISPFSLKQNRGYKKSVITERHLAACLANFFHRAHKLFKFVAGKCFSVKNPILLQRPSFSKIVIQSNLSHHKKEHILIPSSRESWFLEICESELRGHHSKVRFCPQSSLLECWESAECFCLPAPTLHLALYLCVLILVWPLQPIASLDKISPTR